MEINHIVPRSAGGLTDRPLRPPAAAKSSRSTPPATSSATAVLRQVWKRETGTDLDTIPHDLGKFEKAGDEYSIGLALPQVAPYLRTADPLPASFSVPIIREEPKPRLVASYGSTRVAELAGSKDVKRNRA